MFPFWGAQVTWKGLFHPKFCLEWEGQTAVPPQLLQAWHCPVGLTTVSSDMGLQLPPVAPPSSYLMAPRRLFGGGPD